MMKWESEVWLTEPKKELHSRERTLTVTTEYDLLKSKGNNGQNERPPSTFWVYSMTASSVDGLAWADLC